MKCHDWVTKRYTYFSGSYIICVNCLNLKNDNEIPISSYGWGPITEDCEYEFLKKRAKGDYDELYWNFMQYKEVPAKLLQAVCQMKKFGLPFDENILNVAVEKILSE